MTSIIEGHSSATGISVAILGCGKLGTAIIQGLLRPHHVSKDNNICPRPIKRIVASIRNEDKLKPLFDKLHDGVGANTDLVECVVGDNAEAVRRCDVVFLTCHPGQARDCLRSPGMQDAIAGKLVISMLGGVSVATIEQAVYPGSRCPAPGQAPCQIIQAMTSTTAARREAVSIIADKSTAVTEGNSALCEDVLRRFGQVTHVLPQQMSTVTALCASGTAFFTWFLAAMVEGAVCQGVERDQATQLAAITMAGAASAVVNGEDPGAIISRVTTPGGVTAAGLSVLEENHASEPVRGALLATASKLKAVDEHLAELN